MAKKASRVKPERTRSRAAERADENQVFQIDKLGTVLTWRVPNEVHRTEPNLRAAFIGGMKARVEDVNQNKTDVVVPARFTEGSNEQQAFADGYNAAASQDALHLKPAALTGSKAPKRKR